jgi:hypothetical protein
MDILFNNLFDNQKDFGKRIVEALNINQSVLAKANTQCGKTGSMLAAIYLSNIPLDHVFVITGLSSVDWLTQTRNRIPLSHIYHRNTIHSFIKAIKHLTHYIVFIDECHIAFKHGQTIRELIKLFHPSAKTVYVSATPDMKFFQPNGVTRPGFSIRVMKDHSMYRSIQYFKDHNLLFQCKNLIHSDAILDIIPFLHSVPKYHIIRTSRNYSHEMTINNFKASLDPSFSFISMPDDIISILNSKPLVHSFIFIKDTLRCAITIPKQFIGILYERFTEYPSVSSVIQGLAGRATGFHSFDIVIFSFTDIL